MPRNAETSAKAERDRLRDRMRGLGCSVPQIAAEMARRFNMRPRLAWRHALGWPQWKLAQHYNTVHAGAKLSESRISEFESWPHGGSPPSLRYLARLAATYGHGCTPAHLVDADDLEQLGPSDRALLTSATTSTDGREGSTRNSPKRRRTTVAEHSAGEPLLPPDLAQWAAAWRLPKPGDLAVLLMTCLGSSGLLECDAPAMPEAQDRAYDQLVQFLTSWAHTMKRRAMLRTLGWAATAASVGYSLNPDEQARVGSVLNNAARFDTHTIDHLDAVLWRCKRQDDALGPRGVLDTVLAQRELIRSLVPQCSATLQPRLLSTLSNASWLAGWLSFDLNDFASAMHYYEAARVQAHEAENVELSAVVLSGMSHLATWQGRSRIGIDHAVAARQWADQTNDMRLRAHCAAKAAKAYASDGQEAACLRALEAAEIALDRIGDQKAGYIYLYDEGLHISNCGECHLALHNSERAGDCAQQALVKLGQRSTRIFALTAVDLGRARVQSNDIDEAARLFGDAGEIAAQNSSIRLVEVLKQGRVELKPWQHTAAVRALDERLTASGLALV